MIIRIRIDKESIAKKVRRAVVETGSQVAYDRAEKIFIRAFNSMLKDFDKHPVSAEIKAGPRALDYSGATSGYGNLYSFLGFEAGSHPVDDLREVIIANTSLQQTVFRNNGWYFRVRLPSEETIRSVTKMDWGTEDSWINAVEKGLDNLDSFMFKKKFGRSRYGFQAPYEINEDLQFNKQPYLKEIFGNFRDRIENSKMNDL